MQTTGTVSAVNYTADSILYIWNDALQMMQMFPQPSYYTVHIDTPEGSNSIRRSTNPDLPVGASVTVEYRRSWFTGRFKVVSYHR